MGIANRIPGKILNFSVMDAELNVCFHYNIPYSYTCVHKKQVGKSEMGISRSMSTRCRVMNCGELNSAFPLFCVLVHQHAFESGVYGQHPSFQVGNTEC